MNPYKFPHLIIEILEGKKSRFASTFPSQDTPCHCLVLSLAGDRDAILSVDCDLETAQKGVQSQL